MKHNLIYACLIVCAGSVGVTTATAATIDFESVPVGTRYGEAFGNIPGDVVLSQDGIAMSVEEFYLGTFTGFIKAEVGGQYDDFFPTTPLELDNISVQFDFFDVGFDVTLVTLEFQDFGTAGGSNISANVGDTIFTLTDLPIDIAPGVSASIDGNTITLTGDIDRFLIGGQELAIDNVVALPEPTSAVFLGLIGALFFRRRSRQG